MLQAAVSGRPRRQASATSLWCGEGLPRRPSACELGAAPQGHMPIFSAVTPLGHPVPNVLPCPPCWPDLPTIGSPYQSFTPRRRRPGVWSPHATAAAFLAAASAMPPQTVRRRRRHPRTYSAPRAPAEPTHIHASAAARSISRHCQSACACRSARAAAALRNCMDSVAPARKRRMARVAVHAVACRPTRKPVCPLPTNPWHAHPSPAHLPSHSHRRRPC
jgi:hypothetical protein